MSSRAHVQNHTVRLGAYVLGPVRLVREVLRRLFRFSATATVATMQSKTHLLEDEYSSDRKFTSVSRALSAYYARYIIIHDQIR